jgi:hypothetical protein
MEKSKLPKISALALVCAAWVSSAAYAAGLETLRGTWIGSTPGGVGQMIFFPANTADFGVLLPGFQTLSSFRSIAGHSGSQVMVNSELGLRCYYSITVTKDEMVWEQRDGGTNCPPTILLKRAK